MKWIEQKCIEEYGKYRWNKMSIEEQVLIIAEFGKNYLGAFDYIKSFKAKLNYGSIC